MESVPVMTPGRGLSCRRSQSLDMDSLPQPPTRRSRRLSRGGSVEPSDDEATVNPEHAPNTVELAASKLTQLQTIQETGETPEKKQQQEKETRETAERKNKHHEKETRETPERKKQHQETETLETAERKKQHQEKETRETPDRKKQHQDKETRETESKKQHQEKETHETPERKKQHQEKEISETAERKKQHQEKETSETHEKKKQKEGEVVDNRISTSPVKVHTAQIGNEKSPVKDLALHSKVQGSELKGAPSVGENKEPELEEEESHDITFKFTADEDIADTINGGTEDLNDELETPKVKKANDTKTSKRRHR